MHWSVTHPWKDDLVSGTGNKVRPIRAYVGAMGLPLVRLAPPMRLWRADLAVPFDYERHGDALHIGMPVSLGAKMAARRRRWRKRARRRIYEAQDPRLDRFLSLLVRFEKKTCDSVCLLQFAGATICWGPAGG